MNTERNKALDIDALAQEIRRVDGSHDLGAGALAEALLPFIEAQSAQPAQPIALPDDFEVPGVITEMLGEIALKCDLDVAKGYADRCREYLLAAAPSPVAQPQPDAMQLESIKLPPHEPTIAIEDILTWFEREVREDHLDSIKAYADIHARKAVMLNASSASPVAQDERELPPLPQGEEAGNMVMGATIYTADQMREYALAARAATPAQDKNAQNLQIECDTLRHGLRLANDRITDLMAAQDKQDTAGLLAALQSVWDTIPYLQAASTKADRAKHIDAIREIVRKPLVETPALPLRACACMGEGFTCTPGCDDRPLPAGSQDKQDATATLQFLTDVVTAAGLLSHGKADKGLAKRINDYAFQIRPAVFAGSQDKQDAVDAAEMLDWLDKQGCAYGFEDMHEGNRWMIEGPFNSLRDAIDAAMQAQGEKK